MLVGVLISIMISIVVGVSLIPTIITSINTAKSTSNIPTGLSGLLDVLSYVFVAVILLGAVERHAAALRSNLHRITSQIQGNLTHCSLFQWYDNPELSFGLNNRLNVQRLEGSHPMRVMVQSDTP